MQRRLAGVLAVALLAGSLTATTAFAQTKSGDAGMPKVGDDLKDVKLSDYRGKKNVVVAFYIFAFTGG